MEPASSKRGRVRENIWNGGWILREEEEYFEPYSAYQNWEAGFTVKLWHGGQLHILKDGTTYSDGEVAYFDNCNADKFSLLDVNGMVLNLGYGVHETIMYYYLDPRSGNLSQGLRKLHRDATDVVGLLAEVKDFKVIEIFCDHRSREEIAHFCQVDVEEEWEDFIRSRLAPTVTIEEIAEPPRSGLLQLEWRSNGEGHNDVGNSAEETIEIADVGGEERVDETENSQLEDTEIWQQNNEGHVVPEDVPIEKANSPEIEPVFDDGVVTQEHKQDDGAWGDWNEEVLVEDASDDEEDEQMDDDVVVHDINERVDDLLVNDVENNNVDAFGDSLRNAELFIDDEVFESLVGQIMQGAPHLNTEAENRDAENRDAEIMDEVHNESEIREEDIVFNHGMENTDRSVPFDEADLYFGNFANGEEHGLDEDNVYAGLHSRPCSDDEGDDNPPYGDFHPPTGLQVPIFEVSMRFGRREEFRDAVKTTKILTGRPLKVTHNDNKRMRAKCQYPNCPWFLHAKRLTGLGSRDFVLSTMNLEHGLMCEESYDKIRIPAKWVSEKLMDKFRGNTSMPLKQVRHEVDAAFKCEISIGKAYLARKYAVEKIQGSAILQYQQIWNYIEELKRTNPGSTFEVMFEPFREEGRPNKFMRFYSCFSALKEGFLSCCRPIIFLDGCFLTGLYKGQLLTAIGVDGNNGYWPIAWAVVEKEARAQWLWFIKLLVADLGIARDSAVYSIMSDQQKGLASAIQEILPRAERRYCVQHMYSNFKKSHPGRELKDHLWRIASSSTEESFLANLEELKVFDIAAYNWVLKSPPRKSWVKAYFPTHVKCDTLVNNMCESFNSKILKAREKPIISMLEDIRKYVMERIKNRGEVTSKYGGSVCSVVKNIIKERSELASGWTAISNGAGGYEVHHPTKGQFVVVLSNKTCTCRLWQLSGIPCTHAIPCIRRNLGNPLQFVDGYYSKQNFMALYRHVLMPINGHELWPKSHMFLMDPPRYVPQTGRPKKSRFEGVETFVSENGTQRMRRHSVIHCSKCGVVGHNRATCQAHVNEDGMTAEHDASMNEFWFCDQGH